MKEEIKYQIEDVEVLEDKMKYMTNKIEKMMDSYYKTLEETVILRDQIRYAIKEGKESFDRETYRK